MVAYKRLNDQGIKTLSDLFIKYDNDTIEYGIDTKIMGTYEATETKGVVELLRYKYLNESLIINPLTNLTEITIGKDRKEVMYYLQSIGLPRKICQDSYFWICKQRGKIIRLIDLIKELKINNLYCGNYPACFQTTLNEKIRLLLEYCEVTLANSLNTSDLENKENNNEIINRWYEIMNPCDVQSYRAYKKNEVEQAFKTVDWVTYNDAVFLENDEEFYEYIKLKRKIKNNVGK